VWYFTLLRKCPHISEYIFILSPSVLYLTNYVQQRHLARFLNWKKIPAFVEEEGSRLCWNTTARIWGYFSSVLEFKSCLCKSILILPSSTTRCEPGSSVRLVSGYGWTTELSRFNTRQRRKDFFCSLCVQNGSRAHPASCTMGTEGPLPGGKARPERDADHSPHLVPMSLMSRTYTSSPPKRLRGV
jgi:hypothetical protein